MSVARATKLAEAMVRTGSFRNVAVVTDADGAHVAATNRAGMDASIRTLA